MANGRQVDGKGKASKCQAFSRSREIKENINIGKESREEREKAGFAPVVHINKTKVKHK